MTEIEELIIMNKTKIDCLKSLGKNCARNELINQLLKDDAVFFKLSKDDAFIILKDIGISNDIIEITYLNLTSIDEYTKLIKNNIIKENDTNLKIKYELSKSDNIFQNNKTIEINNEDHNIKPYRKGFVERILKKIKKVFHFNYK